MSAMLEWLKEFRALHEKARKDELTGDIRQRYYAAREELATAVIKAQGLTRPEGSSSRQAFRVAQAFMLELRLNDERVAAVTLDVSMGGFSTLIAQAPELNSAVSFSMKLPGGGDPISGAAKLVTVKKQPGNARASFAFERVSEPELARLEFVLFDCVLARMPT